ncbi:CMRF35-like molecule 9 isoform X7 [Bubalus bubalis]|uniref:CMRF35-like molecule 9 isoform X7 n=1 Tax=Bubalus bubalis TaxID=89462 RepID=UPI000DBC58BE|nr:CMRF35-like molecule 9 isoform X7 [Bubalus bubalis]XP_044794840.1 CMRF35-like molecule 9 isoform X7 [Bubalus bubalis]
MRPLLMLWGCLVLPGYGSVVDPKEISGFEGDTVSLQCTYEEQLKKNQKYWCREAGLFISRCTGTVFSGEYGQEGRVSVHDNPQENRFTVILRNLTLKDMGKYWCGVKRLGFDKTMSVSLLVFPGTSLHSAASPLARISPHPATSPYAGTSLHSATSPFARISPHPATSPYAGTSLHPAASPFARISPHPATSPYAGTSLHSATSPPAGISQPATQLDSTSTQDTSFVPSSSSKSRLLPSRSQGVHPTDPDLGPSPGAASPSAGHRPGRPRQLHVSTERKSSTGLGDTEEGQDPSLPLGKEGGRPKLRCP